MLASLWRSGWARLAAGVLCYGVAFAISLPRPPPANAVRALPPASNERRAPDVLPASYQLHARLDPNTHVVFGRGSIEWQNTSRVEVPSLFFHLYLNAFKNDGTLFLRSPFGAGRDGTRATQFGFTDVKTLKVREFGAEDLWPRHAPHSPNDPADETDIELPLPRAVKPGERITLDVEFEAHLPQIVERTGFERSFHLVAQWFPKLARLEPDGSFAHFPFHAQAEFYADFGRYDVTLELPENFRVGASGQRVSDTVANGVRRVRFVAEPVHDFAWTAWEHFVERREKIHGVDVTVLTPPGHAQSAAVTLESVRASLPYFSNHFGSYPYSTLTVVHPPVGAESAGGMEYPTLITTGAPWYLPFTGARGLEAVTVHELGHQWFYGLLASNEARFPFLDEGINSFAEHAALKAAYGAGSAFSGFGLQLSETALFRAVSVARAEDEAAAGAADQFSTFRNLGALVYSRTATVLETIARVYGRAKFDRALRAYTETQRFRHPDPEAFFAALREGLGEDAVTVLRKALSERGRVNYFARELQTARKQVPAGYFERSSGRELVTRSTTPAGEHLGRVTVYRHGDLELPVDVLLVAEDGTEQRANWDGRGAFRVFDYVGDSPLAFALIDPEHKLLIDADLSDNQVAVRKATASRIHERLAYWAGLLLGGVEP